MRSVDDRYHNDPVFAELVNMIYHACKSGKFTPTEVREAATLAQLKYELNNPRPIMLSPNLKEQLRYRRSTE